MGKFALLSIVALMVLFVSCADALSNDCPPSGKMTACSPKCKDDTECFGRKCCPNICNAKSCVPANLSSDSGSGYKGTSSGGAGTYCGNVKCNSYEKCELDKSTKRQKCVRQ